MLQLTIKDHLQTCTEDFRQALQKEGYAVQQAEYDSATNTWDMIVKFEGLTMLVFFDLDDPEFVRIDLPFFCDVPDAALDNAYRVANETNNACKGAKVTVLEQHLDTKVSVEFLHAGEFSAKQIVRYFSMLVFSARRFRETFEIKPIQLN